MIVIKNIEFFETQRDTAELVYRTSLGHPAVCNSGATVPLNEVMELIKGRRFVRPSDGTDIIVGVSNQAAEAIGLMYEGWDNMEKELLSLLRSRRKLDAEGIMLKSTLLKLKAATFWQRIKWVFTGVPK